jgi:hypothetical protein
MATIYFENMMALNVGVLAETMEKKNWKFTGAALGALARFKMDVPGSLNDRVSVTAKFSSGDWNSDFAGFMPVSSRAQGSVFPDKMSGVDTISGLASLSADYFVKVFESVFLDGSLRYFARTYNHPNSAGIFYGGEFWVSLNWQPLDDLRLNVGGGIFFPGMGNADPKGDALLKLIAGLTLSF